VHLAQRLGVLVDERLDAAGLGARQVLAHHPAGGEPHRVLVVDDLGRLPVGIGWKRALPSGWKKTPALVEPGGAGVAHLGDRPEQAHVRPRCAPRWRRCSRRCHRPTRPAQLVEDLLGVLVLEVLALAEPFGDVEKDLPVEPASPGGVTAR
jgi:hypothetical protein